MAQHAARAPSPWALQRASVREVRHLTAQETLLTLQLPEGQSLGHRPCQFLMVSVFGAEEAAISICSPPGDDDTFQLCVRRAGRLTTVLHRLQPGERLFFRGPYGNGYATEKLLGKRLLVVAGGLGLAPLRSLIGWALRNRDDLEDLTLLYGVRRPQDRLFPDELLAWAASGACRVMETVDVGDTGWRGRVGVITRLIREIEVDPITTIAAVCGPPIMYKFAVDGLRKAGLRDGRIHLSLERRMRCGIGKCGHCQINGVYVCQQGPVFSHAEARSLSEAL